MGKICLTLCNIGEFCEGITCGTCHEGTFQNQSFYTGFTCKRWTTKPSGSHWLLAKEGSAISDQKWKCKKGYEEFRVTKDISVCKEAPTEKPTTTNSLLVNTTIPSIHPTNNLIPEDERSQAALVAIVLISIVVFLILMLGLYCFSSRRKRRKNHKKDILLSTDEGQENLQEFAKYLNGKIGKDMKTFLFGLKTMKGMAQILRDTEEKDNFEQALVEWYKTEENAQLDKIGIIMSMLKYTATSSLPNPRCDILDDPCYINHVAKLKKEENGQEFAKFFAKQLGKEFNNFLKGLDTEEFMRPIMKKSKMKWPNDSEKQRVTAFMLWWYEDGKKDDISNSIECSLEKQWAHILPKYKKLKETLSTRPANYHE